MRGKEEEFQIFFHNLNKKGTELEKIKLLLQNKGKDKFFLGVREDYLSLYYMGMSMAVIKAKKTGGCSYQISYDYLKGVRDQKGNYKYDEKEYGYYMVPGEVFWNPENFERILRNIRHHVMGFGKNEPHLFRNDLRTDVTEIKEELLEEKKKTENSNDRDKWAYLEKACQQWIINANNQDSKAEWYYIDMEYIYKEDGEKKDHPFGRADLIAVKKKPEEGVHQIAFVELKVGTGAYGISLKIPKKLTDEKGKKAYKNRVFENLKTDVWKEENFGVKLGSGLASHVIDFMHYFSKEEAAAQLREEIFGIIQVHKTLGMIEEGDSLNHIEDVSQLSKTTDIYIVTYSEVPGITKEMLSEQAQGKYAVKTLREMKEDFGKYFYFSKNSSSLPIECLLNKKQIEGLLEIKDQYFEFIENREQEIACIQKIKDKPYRFIFRFVDTGDEGIDSKKCI